MAWQKLIPTMKADKRVIREFIDHEGLVYFGYVSQRSDEHHIVRGMTVSTQHVDDHYCIGTVDGYDVVFVERTDALPSGKKHTWHIMEFDLHGDTDIPHMFIGSKKTDTMFNGLLAVKYPSLLPMSGDYAGRYPASFNNSFTIHVTPANGWHVEQLVTPETAAMLASHFRGLDVELHENTLYIYSEKNHVSVELLRAMLQNGIWLANEIDKNSRKQYVSG